MEPTVPVEDNSAEKTRRVSEASRGVIWCFIPVDVDAITSCSPGFREYFGFSRDDARDLHLSLTEPDVMEAFGRRGVPPDSIRHLGSSATTASGREISVRIDDRLFLQVSPKRSLMRADSQPDEC